MQEKQVFLSLQRKTTAKLVAISSKFWLNHPWNSHSLGALCCFALFLTGKIITKVDVTYTKLGALPIVRFLQKKFVGYIHACTVDYPKVKKMTSSALIQVLILPVTSPFLDFLTFACYLLIQLHLCKKWSSDHRKVRVTRFVGYLQNKFFILRT